MNYQKKNNGKYEKNAIEHDVKRSIISSNYWKLLELLFSQLKDYIENVRIFRARNAVCLSKVSYILSLSCFWTS